MNKKILVTGATGLIGKKLTIELCRQGALIKIISTNADKAKLIFKDHSTIQIFEWSAYHAPSELSGLIEDTDAVINLAGVNVGESRWTKEYKKNIYDSRINTTRLIVDAIGLCKKRPDCLINSSAVGFYGFREDEPLDEESGSGSDFLAELCRDWETEALKAEQFDVRVVAIRAGVVLDKSDGVLKKFLEPFKFFIGTYMGSGKQWLPWIHTDDVISLYIFALNNNNLIGAVNGVAPGKVTNKQFVKTIGTILNKNIILPVPGIALKIGIGEFANNLLTGQRVSSNRALKNGFSFKFPELKMALENLLKEK
ncbi:MAG: TIGR01777 family oxidoreductase [bacterium]